VEEVTPILSVSQPKGSFGQRPIMRSPASGTARGIRPSHDAVPSSSFGPSHFWTALPTSQVTTASMTMITNTAPNPVTMMRITSAHWVWFSMRTNPFRQS